MAAVGDTQVRFTRSYIFLNPTPEGTAVGAGIGTWRLSVDDEYEGTGPQPPNTDGTTATGTVDPTEESVIVGELLYITSAGLIRKAQADNLATSVVVGAAITEATPGTTITYGTNFKLDIFDTASVIDNDTAGLLLPGANYYLSSVNKGHWTLTPDTTTVGNCVVQCGLANSSNQILVEIQGLTEI
jgi:hypothetical protein